MAAQKNLRVPHLFKKWTKENLQLFIKVAALSLFYNRI